MANLWITLAIIVGVFITLQGSINGMLGEKAGILSTITLVLIIQLLILLGAVMVKGNFLIEIKKIKEMNHGILLLILSALFGIVVILGMTYIIIKIGPAIAFTSVIFSQLLGSMIFEHFGLFNMPYHPITFKRMIALGLMILATKLFMT